MTIYSSFESAGLERVLVYWNDKVPLFSAVTLYSVGLLSWGAAADIAPDEVRVLLLDPAGSRAVLEDGLPIPLRVDSGGRAPLIALLPDESGIPDAASLCQSRAELVDAMAAMAAAGVKEVFDLESRRIAGLLYTDEAMAAVGTAIFRRAYSILAVAPKVLAVDCDGTLWQGVCAEQGPGGVAVGPEERDFHDFLAHQKSAGRLLVLVSKNILDDVVAVFSERADLGLLWSDIAAVRVGWSDKSSALRELARELNVGLDSFVLMDDNPIECSEVRVRCPEVVVLQRPQLGVRRFLEAAWPLDIHASSDGNLGATRTRLYQDEAQRRDALRAAPSYADHLRSLAIETKVRLASAGEQARLFELAQRTNQFQTAADRPSMHAVADSVSAGRLLVVTVADRFGDYGISGGAFFHLAGDVLTADRIMLSCRVLGRGVEENLFDALVDIARERGCNHLDIALTPTLRNVPARRFLEGICGQLLGVPRTSAEGSVIWRFALDGLARCPRLDLLKHAVEEQAVDAVRGISSADWTLVAQMTGDSAALASELGLSPGLPYGSQAQTGEQGVLRVAANVLGRPVARNDNLYALGADSLKIVRLLARLKSVLGIDIPIGDVLYRADVAELLRLSQVGQSQSAATDDGFFDQINALYDDDLPVP